MTPLMRTCDDLFHHLLLKKVSCQLDSSAGAEDIFFLSNAALLNRCFLRSRGISSCELLVASLCLIVLRVAVTAGVVTIRLRGFL